MINSLSNGYLYKKRFVVKTLSVIDAVLDFALKNRARKLPIKIKKILIVKPDHLGDCLLSSSALTAIRSLYPNALIDYVAGPWGTAVLENYSTLNRIWKVRHAQHNRQDRGLRKWIYFWKDLFQISKQIRNENYDLALFLRASGGNLIFASSFWNCKFRAGHGAGGGRALLDRCALWEEGVHEVQHFAEVLRMIHPDFENPMPLPYYESHSNTATVAKLPQQFLCIHPGAGTLEKKLTIKVWQNILSGSSLSIVVCGSHEEIDWVQKLGFTRDREVLDLTNKLSIEQLYCVLDRAAEAHLLDSFPAHLAATSRCGKVNVHFLPASDPVQWRPLGANVVIISHEDSDH